MDTPSLPETLYETLSHAITDARLLSRPDYEPHYRYWHGYQYFSPIMDDNKCKVCLSGAIMSRSLNVDILMNSNPACFPINIERKLKAVNFCRNGRYVEAFNCFYGHIPEPKIQDRLNALPTPSYDLFIGWEDFSFHLESLEAIIPLLQEIELEALKS